MQHEFVFEAPIWLFETTKAAWHFVTLPPVTASQLRAVLPEHKPFGTIPVTARIGRTRWRTSLFKDNKRNSYLLPLQAGVRKREQLHPGLVVEVLVQI
jgi:hypothetical protein